MTRKSPFCLQSRARKDFGVLLIHSTGQCSARRNSLLLSLMQQWPSEFAHKLEKHEPAEYLCDWLCRRLRPRRWRKHLSSKWSASPPGRFESWTGATKTLDSSFLQQNKTWKWTSLSSSKLWLIVWPACCWSRLSIMQLFLSLAKENATAIHILVFHACMVVVMNKQRNQTVWARSLCHPHHAALALRIPFFLSCLYATTALVRSLLACMDKDSSRTFVILARWQMHHENARSTKQLVTNSTGKKCERVLQRMIEKSMLCRSLLIVFHCHFPT